MSSKKKCLLKDIRQHNPDFVAKFQHSLDPKLPPIEVRVLAPVIICLKLLYGLDDINRNLRNIPLLQDDDIVFHLRELGLYSRDIIGSYFGCVLRHMELVCEGVSVLKTNPNGMVLLCSAITDQLPETYHEWMLTLRNRLFSKIEHTPFYSRYITPHLNVYSLYIILSHTQTMRISDLWRFSMTGLDNYLQVYKTQFGLKSERNFSLWRMLLILPQML